jgi:hypothetical protein
MDAVASLYQRNSLLKMVERTAREIFTPLTIAGGIRSIEDIRDLLNAGADKISINTAAVENPKLLSQAAKVFGSQCIVSSIAAFRKDKGDAVALNYKVPTTVECFYLSICKFFNYVQKELDVNIEIAAHPKSNHPPYPDYFGGRKTLRGDTFGMINNSQLVMTHSSTSIQFAILLKKPIIFLTTRELENDKLFSGLINAYAQSLGKKPINIDKPLAIDWEKELHVDEKKYDDYIELYIKKRGSEELNTWQILADRLKDI